jgi:hypothetical protein
MKYNNVGDAEIGSIYKLRIDMNIDKLLIVPKTKLLGNCEFDHLTIILTLIFR